MENEIMMYVEPSGFHSVPMSSVPMSIARKHVAYREVEHHRNHKVRMSHMFVHASHTRLQLSSNAIGLVAII